MRDQKLRKIITALEKLLEEIDGKEPTRVLNILHQCKDNMQKVSYILDIDPEMKQEFNS